MKAPTELSALIGQGRQINAISLEISVARLKP